MIAYVDAVPRVEPKGGNFLVTLESGGDKVRLLLTRHAIFGLGRAAINESCAAFEGAEVIDLEKARIG